jgi:stress-induced morphogen
MEIKANIIKKLSEKFLPTELEVEDQSNTSSVGRNFSESFFIIFALISIFIFLLYQII